LYAHPKDPIPRRLETERLHLRVDAAEDVPAVHAALVASWMELSPYLNWAQGPPPTLPQVIERLDEFKVGFEARSDLVFFIFDKGTGSFIGNCWLSQFDWTVPRGEIAYWCTTDKVGHGYITEAVLALTELAWSLGLVRVELRCDARNRRSRAVAERAGFALEGVLKNESRTPQGALRDICLFAQVPRDVS
jgi:RimJ/RimL family protein N-acetyltransferase